MRSEWRVACVRIPRFPVGAAVEARALGGAWPAPGEQLELLPPAPAPVVRPGAAGGAAGAAAHWDDRPIALAEPGDARERLRAVTAAAGRAGVRAGMTAPEARARCARLEVLAWDDAAVERAVTQTTAALLVASPQVTPVAGAPGMWWVGAGGLERVGGERALVRALLRIAGAWHPRPRVAVADSCVAARAATWADAGARGTGAAGPDPRFPTPLPPGATVVPPGGCAAYLAAAPLGLVPMEEELRRALLALGIRSAGGLAALAPADVERRWGAEGLAAWRLARGEDRRRPVLARAEARRAAAAELAAPAATMEPVLFLVRAALDRLAAELAADGRAAAVVAVTLTLDDGRGHLPAGGVPHTVTREVKLSRPLARVAPLFERVRALLDRWPLTAPVCGVAVEVTATAAASGGQGGLFDLAWRDPAAVDAALDRLRAELGPNVVVRPVARDAHRPERAGAWVEEADAPAEADAAAPGRVPGAPAGLVPDAAGAAGRAPNDAGDPAGDPAGGAVGTAALRLLEAPEAVDVEPPPAADAPPAAMRWRGRRVPLERAVGPERLSGDWWRDGFRRDYWRCTGDGATEFLLYHAEDGRWFLHGWYD